MSRVHRRFLSKSESKELMAIIEKRFKLKASLDRKSKWEVAQLGRDGVVYIIDGNPMIVEFSGELIPSLKALSDGLIELPRITVNVGAVKHIVNGADVMAPGIVKVEGDFERDEPVVVIDERYGRPLCVGIALVSSSEVAAMSKGRVVKNLHHAGDKIWSKLKDLGLV